MTARSPLAAVVIPTRNRAASIVSALEALGRQDVPAGTFEVIAVPNGCEDDTVARLSRLQPPYALRVIPVEKAGASLARNTGASHASAPIVIFLDDDVAPDPWFVAEHLRAHGMGDAGQLRDSNLVVIGYLPAALQAERDRFAITLRGWWEAMFDRMREPGHRFAYTDLLSGNFSIARARFIELDGFDVGLRCHEDYDLGYRLLASGAQFVFAARASGEHADLTRLPRACWRKREEGIADVQLARQYPDLQRFLPMSRTRTINQRVVRTLAFRFPAIGDRLAAALVRLLRVLDSIGAAASWLRVLGGVLGYWYERGLADALGTVDRLDTLLSASSAESPRTTGNIEVDLALGLEKAFEEVDRVRPCSVTLRVGTVRIGGIPWRPGAERLASRHVAAVLVRQYHRPFVEALVSEGRLSFAGGAARPGDRLH